MPPSNNISVNNLLDAVSISYRVLGSRKRIVLSVTRIHEADRTSVTFCNKKAPQGLDMVRNSEAGVVICYDDLQFNERDFHDKTIILVPEPTLAFARIMRKFFTPADDRHGISDKAVVSSGSSIHPFAYIRPHSYIGKCEIGGNIAIGDNTVVGIGAVVTKDVAAGKILMGVPAKEQVEIKERW